MKILINLLALIMFSVPAYANTIQSYYHQTTPVSTDSYLVQEGGSYVYENLVDIQSYLDTNNLFLNLTTGSMPTLPANTILGIANVAASPSRLTNLSIASPAFFTTARQDGTLGSPTTLQSGDQMGGYNAWGYNGSALTGPSGSFRIYANQNWTTGAEGTYADITTTPNGATTHAEVIRFENDAGVTVPSTVTGGDKGAGTINTGGLFVNGNPVVQTISGNATTAQINAGLVIIPAITGKTITIQRYAVQAVGGTAATCTGVYLEDTAGSPVLATTIAAADLTTAIINIPGGAGNTLGAGFTYGLSGLTVSKGVQIIKNGSNCATMTSANYAIEFSVQ